MAPRVPQSDTDLIRHLREQVGFLRRSATAYDEGEYGEAKRLATTVRVLCHDTPQSNALLAQLDLIQRVQFVDTNSTDKNVPEPNPDPDVFTMRFASGLAPMGGFPTGLVAPLDRADRHPALDFGDWWSAEVLDIYGVTFSRRDIVLTLANQDGGAHVDPTLTAKYEDLSRGSAAGTFGYTDRDGIQHDIDVNPALPIMRQVAYEIDETLAPIVDVR